MKHPLRQRPLDIVVLVYVLFNLIFISYFFDLEQVVIPDTSHFAYPAWPPRFLVDLAHWYGRTFDPLLNLRPILPAAGRPPSNMIGATPTGKRSTSKPTATNYPALPGFWAIPAPSTKARSRETASLSCSGR